MWGMFKNSGIGSVEIKEVMIVVSFRDRIGHMVS